MATQSGSQKAEWDASKPLVTEQKELRTTFTYRGDCLAPLKNEKPKQE